MQETDRVIRLVRELDVEQTRRIKTGKPPASSAEKSQRQAAGRTRAARPDPSMRAAGPRTTKPA